MTRTVWADCETTGTRPGRDLVYEIALIVRDEDPLAGDYVISAPDREYCWQLCHDMRDADPFALNVGRYYERCEVADWEPGTGKAVTHPDGTLTHKVLSHREIAIEIALLLPRAVLSAANPAFDAGMIDAFLRAHGQRGTWDYHLRDTGSMIRGYLCGLAKAGQIDPETIPASLALDALVRAVGIDPAAYERHSALGDARLIRDAEDIVTGRLTL